MTDDNTPLLALAAKRVADGRQHGCHYAEGTCKECLEIAESVLRAVLPEHPSGHLLWMMRTAYDRGQQMAPVYRTMPLWRVLYGEP